MKSTKPKALGVGREARERRRGGSYRAKFPTLPLLSAQFQVAAAVIVCFFLRLLLRARRLVPAARCGLDSSTRAHRRPCVRARAHRAESSSYPTLVMIFVYLLFASDVSDILATFS